MGTCVHQGNWGPAVSSHTLPSTWLSPTLLQRQEGAGLWGVGSIPSDLLKLPAEGVWSQAGPALPLVATM